jgi:hypothetical protein
MSSKLKKKNRIERKKEIYDYDFTSIQYYLKKKIFISFSNFTTKTYSKFSQKLTEKHKDRLKKELE